MSRKCLRTKDSSTKQGCGQIRNGGGEREAETVPLAAKVSSLLHRAALASAVKAGGRNGPRPTGGVNLKVRGVSEAAECPPVVPCVRKEDHTCQQSRSDVRRAGTVSREHSSGPGAPRKSGFHGHPSLLALPKLTLPASGVVAVGSGSKTRKPRPRPGASRIVQDGVPEGNPCPPALACPQDAPHDTQHLLLWGASRLTLLLICRKSGRPAPTRGGANESPTELQKSPPRNRVEEAWPHCRRKWSPPRGRRAARAGRENWTVGLGRASDGYAGEQCKAARERSRYRGRGAAAAGRKGARQPGGPRRCPRGGAGRGWEPDAAGGREGVDARAPARDARAPPAPWLRPARGARGR